ncbi:hypothetical protein F5888DRAFT_1838847, partial [Russula emetica]
PILIEGILQSIFQGVIFAQVARYWECPLNDTIRMKSYVLTLAGLSFIQTMFTAYKLWFIFIDFRHWSTSPIVWADLFLNGLICTVCEVSLLRRCWKVTKQKTWVVAPLAFLLVTIFIANICLPSVSSQIVQADSSPVLDVTITSIRTSWWLPVVYLTFAPVMVYLWHSRTGVDNLDKVLNHIIAVTWGSAAIPSVFQIIAVSLYNSESGESHNLVLFFWLMTGKLYTLGIMRSLNSRPDLRGLITSVDMGRTSLSDWQWGDEQENTVSRRASEVRPPT